MRASREYVVEDLYGLVVLVAFEVVQAHVPVVVHGEQVALGPFVFGRAQKVYACRWLASLNTSLKIIDLG